MELRTAADPWRERIFRKMIRAPEALSAGSWVRLVSRTGDFLAFGHLNLNSQIAVRPLSADPAFHPADPGALMAFYAARLAEARRFREHTLGLNPAGGYRLIHGEADRLGGLSVDVFGAAIGVEIYTAGMAADRAAIGAALAAEYRGARVAFMANQRAARLEGFRIEPTVQAAAEGTPSLEAGSGGAAEIVEHGLRFEVAVGRGHKTGFFLDQRDNRARIAALAAGRRVLDLCCYTGGFALHAWQGGAARVRAVDLDEAAVAQARRNAALNGNAAAAVEFIHADAFEVLRAAGALASDAAPDLIVLDPPKLAEDRHELESAARKYRDLMRLALAALAPDGILLTCSCSGPVSETMFLEYLQAAAAGANCSAAIFQIAGAAPDHPIGLHHLEGRYLKAVYCRKSASFTPAAR